MDLRDRTLINPSEETHLLIPTPTRDELRVAGNGLVAVAQRHSAFASFAVKQGIIVATVSVVFDGFAAFVHLFSKKENYSLLIVAVLLMLMSLYAMQCLSRRQHYSYNDYGTHLLGLHTVTNAVAVVRYAVPFFHLDELVDIFAGIMIVLCTLTIMMSMIYVLLWFHRQALMAAFYPAEIYPPKAFATLIYCEYGQPFPRQSEPRFLHVPKSRPLVSVGTAPDRGPGR